MFHMFTGNTINHFLFTELTNVDNELVVKMPHFASIIGNRSKYPYFPHSIPADLADKLSHLHGDPVAWWVGQIIVYLMKPNKQFKAYFKQKQFEIGFRNPIVG